jgi:hypothetical protein
LDRAQKVRVVDLLQSIAQRKHATPGQIALAWLRGAEAVDCADSRHDETAPAGGEHQGCGRGAHGDGGSQYLTPMIAKRRVQRRCD